MQSTEEIEHICQNAIEEEAEYYFNYKYGEVEALDDYQDEEEELW